MTNILEWFSKKRIAIIILLLVLILFVPFGVIQTFGAPQGYHPTPNSIHWITFTWSFIFSSSDSWSIVFYPYYSSVYVLQLPMRALFLIEGVNFAEGKSSNIRLLASGILGDLLVIVPMALLALPDGHLIIMPIPLMTLIGAHILLKFRRSHINIGTESEDSLDEGVASGKRNQTHTKAFFIVLFLTFLAAIIPSALIIGFSILGLDTWFIEISSNFYRIVLRSDGLYLFDIPFSDIILFPIIISLLPRFSIPVLAYHHFIGRVSLKQTLYLSIILEIALLLFISILSIFVSRIGLLIPLPFLSISIFIISKALAGRQLTSDKVPLQ
ncbi:MAG: hypothetical protein ACFFED_16785 [Candidatus Thorarchaeota archaeon]